MKGVIFIDGKRYISASRAAEISKYSKDYIGQLCRGGKIEATMPGRTWFVNEESLLAHKKSADEALEARYREYGQRAMARGHAIPSETAPRTPPEALVWKYETPADVSTPAPIPTIPIPTVPAPAVPVKAAIPPIEWKFSYASDERPLLPELEKKSPEYIAAELPKAAPRIKSPFVSDLRLIAAMSAVLAVIGVGSILATRPGAFIGPMTRSTASIADAFSSIGLSISSSIGSFFQGIFSGGSKDIAGESYPYYPYYSRNAPVANLAPASAPAPALSGTSSSVPANTGTAATERARAVRTLSPNLVTLDQVDARIQEALLNFRPWTPTQITPTYNLVSQQSNNDAQAGGVAIGQSIGAALTNGSANFNGQSITVSGRATVGSLSVTSGTFTSSVPVNLNVGTNLLLSTNSSGLVIATTTPSVAAIFATSTTATSTFAGGLTVGDSQFVIQQATGRIGIGTTIPVSKLHVSIAPAASANYGTVSIGSGSFDGSSSNRFAGSALGTSLAVNELPTYTGNLIDLQKGGTSTLQVDYQGNTTINTTGSVNAFTVARYNGEARLTIKSVNDSAVHNTADDYPYFQMIRNNYYGAAYRPIITSDLIGRIAVRGPKNTSGDYNGDGALGIDFFATEDWNTNATGGRIAFFATSIGTNSTYFPLDLNNESNSSAAVAAVGDGTITNIFVAKTTASGSVVLSVNKSGNTFVGGKLGIGTSTPNWSLQVASSTPYLAVTDTNAGTDGKHWLISNNDGLFKIGTSSDVLSSTSTALTINQAGNLGIGTTTPWDTLSVNGRVLINGTTTISAADAGITFTGSGVHDITAAGGTLRIGSNTIIGSIEALNETVDIGTPGVRFDKFYANEVNATTLVGTITGGNSSAETFTINSDNATADTENSYLSFERGSIIPNALLSWNAGGASKRFEFNQPLFIQNASASTTLTTFDIQGVSNQTADLLRIFDSSSNYLLNFSAAGRLGLASTSPWAQLSVNPNGITGPSFVVGSSTATNFVVTNGGMVGIGTVTPNAALQIGGTGGGLLTVGTLTNDWGADMAIGVRSGNGVLISKINTGNEQNRVFLLYNDPTEGAQLQLHSTNGAAGTATIRLSGGGTSFLNAGNVGIGTTTPQRILTVTNSGSNGQLMLTDTGAVADSHYGEIGFSRGGFTFNTMTDALATTSRMVINSSGNVGIGTTTPWGQLSVNPNALGSRVPEFIVGSSTATHFIIDGSGNVGIGTTTPGHPLDVITSATNPGGTISLFKTSLDDYTAFQVQNSQRAWQFSVRTSTDSNPGGFNFYNSPDGSGSWTSVMALTTTGNVGIGETAPGSKLSVSGGATIGASYDTTAAPTNGLIIEGNVGIGTTTPYSLLTLYKAGSTAANSPQLVLSASSTVSGLSLAMTNWAIGTDLADGGKFKIASSSVIGTNDRLVIDGSGNVGIGSTTPGAKLDVLGSGVGNSGIRSDAIRAWVTDANNGSSAGYFSTNGQNSAYSLMTGQGNIFLGSTGTSSVELNGFLYEHTLTSSVYGNLRLGDITNFNAGGQTGGQIVFSGDSLIANTDSSVFGMIRGIKENGSYNNSLGALVFGTQSNSGGSQGLSTVTEKMRIDSTGNVGIGTTSPVSKLSVLGESALAGGLSVGIGYAGTAAPTGGMIVQGNLGIGTTTPWAKLSVNQVAGDVGFSVGSSTATSFIVATNGYAGIGTAAPTARLDIRTSGTEDLLATYQGAQKLTYITSNGGLFVNEDTGGDNIALTVKRDTGNTYLQVYQKSVIIPGIGATESDGGILEITSGSTLAREGTGDVSGIKITPTFNPTASSAFGYGIKLNPIINQSGTATGDFTALKINPTKTNFLGTTLTLLDVGIGNSTKMIVTEAGNVGIGTTSPGTTLGVAGTGLFNGALTSFGINTAPSFVATSTTATSTFAGGLAVETSGLVYDYSTNNVGIGTAGPGTPLHVYNALDSIIQAESGGSTYGAFMRTKNADRSWMTGVAGDLSDSWILYDSTASAVRMLVNSSGNVGIGTTSPGSVLSVQGNGYISSGLFVGGSITSTSSTASIFPYASTTALTSTGSAYFATTQGNVGIGTTNPNVRLGQHLDVASSANYGGMSLSTWTTTGDQGPILDLKKSASATIGTHTIVSSGNLLGSLNFRGSDGTDFEDAGSIHAEVDGTPGDNDMPGRLTFWTTPDNTNQQQERMRITNAGNVGIGTTSPSGLLNAYSTTVNNPMLVLTNTNTTAGASVPIFFASKSGGSMTNVSIENGGLGNLNFRTGATTETGFGTAQMVITSAGNTGIGTTTPNNKLDIYSTTKSAIGFSGATGDTNKWTIGMDVTNGGRFAIASSTALGTTDRFIIDGNGNVGINTVTPDVLGAGSTWTTLSIQAPSGTLNRSGILELISYGTSGDNSTHGYVRFTTLNQGGTKYSSDILGSRDGADDSYTALKFVTTNAGTQSTAMKIAASGNVGIGTTSPYSLLTLYKAGSTAANSPQLVLSASSTVSGLSLAMTNWAIGTDLADGGKFKIASSSVVGTNDRFVIDGGGNVGIGTTTPGATLNIHAATGVTPNFLITDVDVAHGVTDLINTAGFFRVGLNDGGAGGAYVVGASDTGTIPGLYLVSALGVTDPTDTTPSIMLNGSKKGSGTAEAAMGALETVLQVSTGVYNSETKLMTILGSGNVGIGTTTPSTLLHLNATGATTARLGSGITTNDYGQLQFYGKAASDGTSVGYIPFVNTLNSNGVTVATIDVPKEGNTQDNKAYIAFSTHNNTSLAEKMRITSSGNVGIGTTSPGSVLSVQGNGYISSGLFVGGSITSTSSTASIFPYASTTALTSTGSAYFATTQGNVGIGTTSPGGVYGTKTEINISDTTASGILTLTNSAAEATNRDAYVRFMVGGTGSVGLLGYQEGTSGAIGDGTDQFFISSQRASTPLVFMAGGITSTDEKMRITSTGNVGIGTTTPLSPLHVFKNAGGDVLTVESGESQNSFITFRGDGTGTEYSIGRQDGSDEDLFLIAGRSGVGSDVVLNSSGNVGIGTTSPASLLSIIGGSITVPAISVGGNLTQSSFGWTPNANERQQILSGANGANGYGDLLLASNNTEATGQTLGYLMWGQPVSGKSTGNAGLKGAIGMVSVGSGGSVTGFGADMTFYTKADNSSANPFTEQMRITSTGNIGIGTTSPSYKLEIAGSVGFPALPTSTGNAYVCIAATGAVSTSTSCTASSLRFKENISDMSYGLSQIMALRPVSYVYKPDIRISGDQIGLIAEEVAGVVPEVIGYDDIGPANIDYARLAPVVIKAIQEMQSAVNTQSAPTSTMSVMIDGVGNVSMGYGTTTFSQYKLAVNGDVAATSFVNISTRAAKTNINYLDAANKDSILNKISDINIATYRYKDEPSSDPLRLGLIAEEAPSEVLAAGGKGVDIYKLSTFTLAGIQAQQKQIDTLKLTVSSTTEATAESTITIFDLVGLTKEQGDAITAIQSQITILAGRVDTLGTTTQSLVLAVDALKAQVTALSSATSSTISSPSADIATSTVKSIFEAITDWTVSKLSAKIAYIDRVEAKTVAVTQGFDITDQATGVVWCVVIKNGEWSKVPWACGTPATAVAAAVQSTQPVTTPIDTQSTANVIQENQAAPTPEPVATTTPEVATSTPEPILTPTPTPEIVATSTEPMIATTTEAVITATTTEPVTEPVATSTPATTETSQATTTEPVVIVEPVVDSTVTTTVTATTTTP